MDWQDTIIGPATSVGDGCRAILRLTGPAAAAVTAKFIEDADLRWQTPFVRSVALSIPRWNRSVPATLLSWPTGRSSTGQPAVEWHVPAGQALSAALQSQAVESGVRLARPGEFTMRAFLAGRLDLAQAEGVLGLVEAEDLRQLAFAIDQRTGGLSRPLTASRSDLLDLLADIEAGLDFIDEDIEFVSDDALMQRLRAAEAALAALLNGLTSRCLAAERPRVVLLGPPNAGKSSLFNALAGERIALIGPEAGTTRDYLTAVIAVDGGEIEVVDTAGVDPLAEANPLGVFQQAAAERARLAAGADVVAYCLPAQETASSDWTPAPRRLLVRTFADLGGAATDRSADYLVSSVGPPGVENLRRGLQRLLSASDRRVGGARIAERCRTGVESAQAALAETIQLHHAGAGLEYVAVALRETLAALGEIVGAVYTDDLLDRIFSRFCIGK